MDKPEHHTPSQIIERVKNSAVSLSGNASTYNIAGNQNLYYAAPPTPWAPLLMLPPRAQPFVGREEDLLWLLQELTNEAGMTLALCGPGGMGKTALAAEALSRLVAQEDWLVRFPGGIFYHSFYSYPSLAVAFEELAHLFGEESSADPHRAAIRALSRRRALLVFDGVEILDDALPLRELGGKHVVLLLSRRQSDAPDLAHRRDLQTLSQEQSITLLQGLAGQRAADLPSVERLVQHISGYPLALQLIGSYLSSRQEEVADYLQWFEREGLATLHHGEHQAQSVSVLLQRTYDSLSPSEQHVFVLQGLLAPAPFPLELVRDILELPEQAIQQVLGSLVNLSVLRRPDLGYEVSHTLVHTFATERLSSPGNASSSPSSETITAWRERVLITLVTHFDQSDPYDRIALILWQPHVLPLLSTTSLTAQQRLTAAYLFNVVGFHASIQGKYAEAEPLYQRALTIREQQLGATHLDTAISLNNLAELYREQGKYAEAEPLLVQALAVFEQQLGATHPNTAGILNNLALLYATQGKYAEAEPLYQGALTIRAQQLGATHPDTAISLSTLAQFYIQQSKYIEAESLLQRACTIFEKQLGIQNSLTATCFNDLARLYQIQGKYAEAEPLLVQSLAVFEQQLGATHPTTAGGLSNLAALYMSQGKYVKAEPLYLRALAILEQRLGAQHPDTAISLNNLATLYYEQGKYAEAEPLYQRALTIKDRELDAGHPSMATSLNNLAALYKHQGKYVEAEPLYQRALTIREQQLGAMHPDTAISLNNLAELYREQGKYAEAEPLLTQALVICEQQLGATHSNTARSLNNLALLYQVQGKYAKAEPLLMRTLTIFEQQLGTTHSNTVQSLDNLAALYVNQGKYAEAKPLLERVLAIRKQTLGETNPSTLVAKMNYDSLLDVMGRDVEVIMLPQGSTQIYHQREAMRKKAKNKMVKQSRKNNRNR